MNKFLLSGFLLWGITLSDSAFASDDSPLPDVVKAPSPANPVPIPYPNIVKGAEKPVPKSNENEKRVDKDFDRRGKQRFNEGSKYPETKQHWGR